MTPDEGATSRYYDQAWAQVAPTISAQEEQRINETVRSIPEGVSSILDVGCGDGRITNRLSDRYSVVGVDTSAEALRHVLAEHVLGNIDALPFPASSFDLVLCCEVLEHLPDDVYAKALSELERVAREYLLITVPNAEDLRRSEVRCPSCNCVFNANRHLRSFRSEGMACLFGQFRLLASRTILPRRNRPFFLVKTARLIGISPAFFPPSSICPQCGFSPASSYDKALEAQKSKSAQTLRRNGWSRIRKLVSYLAPKTQKSDVWLIALYQREATAEPGRDE